MKSYAAMNERMVEIKALNLILSLLYMLIISLVKLLSYYCSLSFSTATPWNF